MLAGMNSPRPLLTPEAAHAAGICGATSTTRGGRIFQCQNTLPNICRINGSHYFVRTDTRHASA